MEMLRRIIGSVCGDMGVILMMVLMLDLTWIRGGLSGLTMVFKSFGCAVDVLFSHDDATKSY